jgi:hypothetical protein
LKSLPFRPAIAARASRIEDIDAPLSPESRPASTGGYLKAVIYVTEIKCTKGGVVGLDVDDTQYHGSALNKSTGELIDFQCLPTLKGLDL